ncbi:scaffolding protein [Gordonia phage Camerico]|nr:scaffolding protein [Gordonia phage Camerico]
MTLTSTLGKLGEKESLVVFAGESLLAENTTQTQKMFERDGNSILKLENVPVFRSGSFRDSMGFPHEFDDFAMDSMVRNFDHLYNQEILKDIPVRQGHRGPFTNRMAELVGYVIGMRTEKRTAPHDGKEYTYLLADFEILDNEAQGKIKSGLWRNRSAEIGTYVDNRDNEYGPAFLGVAYVDIPAVEGLNGFSRESSDNVHFMMEDQMTGVATPPVPGTPAAPQFSFELGGQKGITDFAAVQNYISQIEAANVELGNQVTSLTTERDDLKGFKDGLFELEKTSFVEQLVKDGKVLAPQKDALISLAKSLSDDQYETWKGSYENVAKQDILENHGGQSQEKTHRDSGDDNKDAAAIAFEQDKKMLRILSSNMTEDALKNTEAYASAVAYDSNFSLGAL